MNVKMWKLWNLLLLSVGNVSSDFSRQLIRLTTKCKLFLGQWLPSQLRSVVSGSAPLRRGLSSRQTWSGRNSRSFLWPFQWNYKMLVMGVSCPALNVAELPKLLNVAPEARKTVTSPPSPPPGPCELTPPEKWTTENWREVTSAPRASTPHLPASFHCPVPQTAVWHYVQTLSLLSVATSAHSDLTRSLREVQFYKK